MDDVRGMTSSDVLATQAAIDSNRNWGGYNNGFFGNGDMGFFWIFALLFMNNNGWGGNWGANSGFVTQADLANSQAQQTQQLQMSGMQQQISDARYDLAQAMNAQTSELVQQNNTNLINAIQGFNNLSGQVTNQTNVLSQQIQALSAQMNQCCCDIKTQMLQQQLDEANAKIVEQRGEISNAQQTQTILNTLGRFVAWAGQGSQAAAAAS